MLDFLEALEPADQLVQWEQVEFLGQRDRLAVLEPLELQVSQEKWVRLGLKEPRVRLEQLETLETLVHSAHQVQLVPLVQVEL